MDFTIEEFSKGELTLLAGSPECGKTFFAISMALALAEIRFAPSAQDPEEVI